MLRRLMANDFLDFFPNVSSQFVFIYKFNCFLTDLLFQLSPENQKQFKDNLLLSVNNEKNDLLRRRMCDVASEVARNQLDEDGNNSWPEFLNFLFQCANSPSNDMKDSALRMFTLVKHFGHLN